MAAENKPVVQQADFIEPVSDVTPSGLDYSDDNSGNEIVTALQHTGEEVGLTWRSCMAAAVSSSPLPTTRLW